MKSIEEITIEDQPPIEKIAMPNADMGAIVDEMIRESGSIPPKEAVLEKPRTIPHFSAEKAKLKVLKAAADVQSPEEELRQRINSTAFDKDEALAEHSDIIRKNLAEKIGPGQNSKNQEALDGDQLYEEFLTDDPENLKKVLSDNRL